MYLKHIPMDGPQNFRDLGGFYTENGMAVTWSSLYRADSMSSLSEKDVALLRKLNVRTVVDLRGLSEQKAMPDILPEGIIYCSRPLMQEEFTAAKLAAEASFAQSMKTSYLKMIEDGAVMIGAAVKSVMEGLSSGAVVFHCTAGKDRTGILAAILLLLLGARDEDILADYQVSYTYNEKGVNRLVQQFPELKQHMEQAGEDSMFHSNPENMKAVLAVLNTGNIGSWLESAGVSRALQQSFRSAMLESI